MTAPPQNYNASLDHFAIAVRGNEAAGPRFAAGVVLYDGSASIDFGEKLFAVPLRQLQER